MPYLLRYLLYTDPSRQQTVQVGQDEEVDTLPDHRYGTMIEVESTFYVVANISRLGNMAHPTEPGRNLILNTTYLARPEQWSEFDEPEFARWIREQEEKKREGS